MSAGRDSRLPDNWLRARRQKSELEREIDDLRHEGSGPARTSEARNGRPGHLFVAGVARSGVSALIRLLNSDPRIAIGAERYKYRQGKLRGWHFKENYFLNPTPDETNIHDEDLYRRLREKWKSGGIEIVGDKIAANWDRSVFGHLVREFPDCRFLYMHRDAEGVASSFNKRAADPEDAHWPSSYDYRKAVARWNTSLRNLRILVRKKVGPERVMVLRYEQFYSGDRDSLQALYHFLGFELVPEVENAYESATTDWPERDAQPLALDDQMRDYLKRKKHSGLEAWALNQARAGRAARA